ncbi:MAG: lactate racemase domain-containing protein [Planctomycetota bacterium]
MNTACDWPNAARVGPAAPNPLSEAEVTERVRASLASPLGYPSLLSATAPGDRLAVAIAENLPQAGPATLGAMLACFDAGVSPDSIALVGRAAAMERATLFLRSADEQLTETVEFVTHEPTDEESTAMLSVTAEGEPIRLNRVLFEADVVLSLGTTAGAGGNPRSDFLAGLYPGLADSQTLRQLELEDVEKASDHIHDAVWRLGLGLAVALLPGQGGGVGDIVAGSPDALRKEIRHRTRKAWSVDVEKPADLVVAELSGPGPLQTWQALAAALTAAERFAKPGAPVIARSQIDLPLGAALSRLVEDDSPERIERQLRKDRMPDSAAVLTLAQVLDRRPVFLESALQPQLAEALGFSPLADEYEVERLVGQHVSVVVLPDAQFVLPVVRR